MRIHQVSDEARFGGCAIAYPPYRGIDVGGGMTSKHQVAEASVKYLAEAAGQAAPVEHSNTADHISDGHRINHPSQYANLINVGWISVSASTRLPAWQGLVDALSLIHPTDVPILRAA